MTLETTTLNGEEVLALVGAQDTDYAGLDRTEGLLDPAYFTGDDRFEGIPMGITAVKPTYGPRSGDVFYQPGESRFWMYLGITPDERDVALGLGVDDHMKGRVLIATYEGNPLPHIGLRLNNVGPNIPPTKAYEEPTSKGPPKRKATRSRA